MIGRVFDHLYVWLVLLIGLLFAVQISRAEDMRRMESIRWDPETHVLTCTVSIGRTDEETKKYVPTVLKDYEISLDKAEMSEGEDKRAFGDTEAALVHRVVDILEDYARGSVDWFERGRKPAPNREAGTPGK